VVLSACAPPDTALRVTVQVQNQGASRVRADCLKLAVSNETQELKSLTIKLPADGEAIFGVRRGQDLPATVKLQAFGYFGDCADESSLKLNAQGSAVTMAFPEEGVGEVTVLLEPPSSSLDADRDGYVAASKNGIDCRDDDATIYPGANQICANTSDTDCDGLGGCDDSECGTAAVCADPPDRVVITTAITDMMRYECKGPFTVSLANAAGPRIAVRDTAVALETDRAGVTVHAVSNCMGDPVASLPIAYGASSFDVYLKVDGQALGPTRLRATAEKVMTPGAVTIDVRPQPVASIAFTSPPRTVRAGECSTEQVTLELRDADMRRTDVMAPTTVNMRNMPGDIANANIFFSDSACTVSAEMTQLPPGQGTVALYVKASRAGMISLTADPAVVPSVSQPLTVQPAAASQLAYTNGALVLNTTQTCSPSALEIQVRDRFDNPVPVSADLPIRLTETTNLGVDFFATPNCMGSPQADYVIGPNSTGVSVYARSMTARSTPGSVRAAVTNGAAITPATQDIRVSAGAASAFVMSGGPESPLASVCSANPFRIELRDAANNPASSATPTTFTLSTVPASTDSTFGFFSGAGCQTALNGTLTIPAGQSSATFYFRGNKVANFEVRAASTLTAPATGLVGNQIRPNVPGRLVFGAPTSQSTQSIACTASTFNANVFDLFDNPTVFSTAQTVTVTPSPAGPRVGSGTCDQGSVVLPANTSVATFNAGHNVTGTYSLVATVNGFSTSQPVTLTVTPGPSTLVADVPLNGATNIVAGNCQVITLARRDINNNNAPVTGNQAVTVTLPPSTDWRVYPTNNCTGTAGAPISMNATHTVTFSVIPRTSGMHQLRASIGAAATLQTANVNFNVSPATPTLVFETPPTNLGVATATQTAGGCTPVTVARKDAFGNDVPLGSAANVTFTLPSGTTVHTASPCTAGNAVSMISLTSSDVRTSFFVSATRSAVTGGPQLQSVVTSLASQSATLDLTVNPGAPILRVATPANGMTTTTANTCVPVTVERRDSLTNLVPTTAGMNLTVSPTTNLSLFNNSDCTGPTSTLAVTSGSSTRSFGLRTDVMNPNLALTLGLDGQTTPLTLTVNPGPLAVLTVLGAPANMTAGGCIGPLTVRRRDNFGNDITNGAATVAMSSTPFTFSAANDCSGAVAPFNVNIADGAAVSGQFYARATTAGSAQMTATIGSVNGNASVTVNPAAPTLSVIVPAGGSATVTAGSCVPVTVERRDTFTNLVPTSGAMNLTVTPGANLSVFSATDCSGSAITNVPVSSGSSSRAFSVRTTLANPSLALSVNLDGQSDTLTLTVNPGPASTLVVQGLPASMISGACAGPITLRRRDANSNDVTSGAATVTLSSAAFSFSTASDCSGATTGGSVNIADTQSVSGAFYVTATAAGAASFTATAGAATGNGSLTVNPGAPASYILTTVPRTFTAGVCAGAGNVISVQLKDAAGNNTVAAGNVVITASSSSGTGLWYTNNSCGAQAAGGAFTISTGNGTASMFYRDNTAGPITVTLTNGAGLMNPANQMHTVNPAAAARLVFTTPLRSFTAAQCGGAGNVITVRLEDAFSNVVTAGGSGVGFTAASNSTGTATFFTNDTCGTTATGGNFTIPNGQSTVNVYYRDSRVGTPSVSLTNGSSLSNPAAQVHTVLVGPASQLAFTSAVQNSVPALGCSGAVDVELRDAGGNVVTVSGTRTVTMSATAAANVTWYSDSSCNTALTGGDATITNGNSSVRVYFRAENTGAITLTAASSGVTNGTQGATIIAANPSQLVVTTADATIESGFCQLVTVQRQDSLSRPATPASATTVTHAVAPTSGLSYFSDATCATALGATFNIASGQSSANVYVKGTQASLSGTTPGSQLYTLTFTAPSLTQDTAGITVLPMARRRSATCQIGANQQTTTCAITPTLSDISRTMLFFQAAAGDADDTPSEDHVTCALQLNGGAAEMACTRSVSTGAALDIEWQTLSFPYPSSQAGGVSVQHLSGGCTAAATNAMPINTGFTANPSATTGNTFVLFSHRSTGNNNDFEHHFTGRLTATNNFRVEQAASSTTCSVTMGFTAQVVTWNGAAVVRGVQAGGSGASFTATATSTTNRSFVLHSSRMATSDTSSNDICRRRLKGEITNGTTLTFTRGCTGSDVQDIAWELITVPATASVATLGGNTGNNGNNVNLAMSNADLVRGVAFLSGMGPGGTANSATDYNSGDQVGAAQGRAVVNSSSQVGVARPGSDGVGQFSGFFLQVTP
jgi:hypothetical protein